MQESFFQWHEITRDDRGRERRRILAWRMTCQDVIAHGLLPENLGKIYEMVPNSEERRHTGGQNCYGHHLVFSEPK